jgi:hypothetical protein
LDVGTQALTNAEVLAHLNGVQARWERDGRMKSVPGNAQNAVRDVSYPAASHNCLGQFFGVPSSFNLGWVSMGKYVKKELACSNSYFLLSSPASNSLINPIVKSPS